MNQKILKIKAIVITAAIILSAFIVFDANNVSAESTIKVPEDYSTIQDAIDAANSGDTIIVNAGTYYENIVLKSGVTVKGAGADVTIINGGGTGSVITADEVGSSTKIEGFTITKGHASSGGGIKAYHSSLTVENCIISSNTADETGGGMHNSKGSIGSPQPKLINCIFRRNSAGGLGGGGIYNSMVSAIITNCVFWENLGDGVFNYASSPKITNCVFWGNSPTEISNVKGSNPTVRYCVVQGGYENGDNIITSHPTFINPSKIDFHLKAGSPCIDAGDNTAPYLPDLDMDGNQRVYKGQVDIGVFEYGSSEPVTEYTLSYSVSPSGSGSIKLDPSGGVYDKETTVTATASAFSGYVFSHWSGDASGTNPTIEITMNSDKSITVYFVEEPEELETYTLTTSISGGGLIEIYPLKESYNSGSAVRVTAVPNNHWKFDHWSGDINDKNPQIYLKMDSDKSITAYFSLQNFVVVGDYQTIQDAIDKTPNGYTIYIGSGVYYENILIECKSNVRLVGYEGAGSTIINGGGTDSVIELRDCDHISIIGLTITNGNTENGGGINCNNNDCMIANCLINKNVADQYGGGLYSTGIELTVYNCTFTNNRALYGGGLSCNNSQKGMIANSIFWKNQAYDKGGGSYFNGARADDLRIINCNFYDNTAINQGGGIFHEDDLSTYVVNSILWDNTPEQIVRIQELVSTASLHHCCIDGFYLDTSEDPRIQKIAETMINTNPKFIDAENGNFHLHSSSECIDAGDIYHSQLITHHFQDFNFGFTDFDGEPREIDGDDNGIDTVDIGVDEYNPKGPIFWNIILDIDSLPLFMLETSVKPSNSGIILLNPSGFLFEKGVSTNLTVIPASGYLFDHWSGDASGTNPNIQITMDNNKDVTAHFTVLPGYYTLTTDVDPVETGFITLTPEGGIYEEGAIVTLNATAKEGCSFSHWSGDASGTNLNIQITMDNNKDVTAHFIVQSGYYILTTDVNLLEAGVITLTPGGGVYKEGTTVTLDVKANTGYSFDYWGGAASGINTTVQITMDSDKAIIAFFEKTGDGSVPATSTDAPGFEMIIVISAIALIIFWKRKKIVV